MHWNCSHEINVFIAAFDLLLLSDFNLQWEFHFYWKYAHVYSTNHSICSTKSKCISQFRLRFNLCINSSFDYNFPFYFQFYFFPPTNKSTPFANNFVFFPLISLKFPSCYISVTKRSWTLQLVIVKQLKEKIEYFVCSKAAISIIALNVHTLAIGNVHGCNCCVVSAERCIEVGLVFHSYKWLSYHPLYNVHTGNNDWQNRDKKGNECNCNCFSVFEI